MKIELDKKQLAISDYKANESFKALRTNIMFCGDDVKVISLTSATPNEGKSAVSLNLAASLAELGKKVIYIDADLRKSVVRQKHRIKGVTDGFSHFLSGIKKFEEVVCSTNVPNLYMVLAGPVPPNPAELLASKYFKVLLDNLRQVYDYVIIDTPPMGSVTDAAIVAKEVDGTILVVAANAVSYKFEQKVLEDLKKSDCRVLGAVLNKVDMAVNKYYGKYYGRYYGKYYGKYYGNYGAYGEYGHEKDAK